MKFYITDIIFISICLYFGMDTIDNETFYAINIDQPSCQEINFEKQKPFESFNLYSFQLNKENELIEIQKIQKAINKIINKTSTKEGIIIHFTNSSYQSYISILTILAENKIDQCFFLKDAICYIPKKEFYPEKLVYTNVNKYQKPIKIITIP